MPNFDLELLQAKRYVAIIRGTSVEYFAHTAETLVQNGISLLEFPLTTPGVLEFLPKIVDGLGTCASIGIGSVTTVAQAKASLHAGAQFLVSPNLDLRVIEFARSAELPILAGAFTPTEIFNAWSSGVTAVKVFPASLGGPEYVKQLHSGPFPDIPLLPTGGISAVDVPAFLSAGAVAFGLGGSLLGSAPDGGSQYDLRSRVREFQSLIGQ